MNNPHILVDLNEAASKVIGFIGTDKFKEIVQAIDNNAQSGFTAGLSFALSLAMAECKTYLYREEESKSDQKVPDDHIDIIFTDGNTLKKKEKRLIRNYVLKAFGIFFKNSKDN